MDAAGEPHSQSPETRPGLDRRALIKRAAVAGAVAWTAPAVIGSIAAPAGAATGACRYTQWDIRICGFDGFTNAQDCVPPALADCTAADIEPDGFCADAIEVSCPTAPVGSTAFRLKIPAGCSCTFVAGAAKGTGTGSCISGAVSAGGKQLDFMWGSVTAPTRVSFQITC